MTVSKLKMCAVIFGTSSVFKNLKENYILFF